MDDSPTTLFNFLNTSHGETITPKDFGPEPNRDVPLEDRQRLTGQCRQILRILLQAQRLERDPVTNTELGRLCLKYTGRISEVRIYLKQFGETIKCTKLKGGLTEYRIKPLENQGS